MKLPYPRLCVKWYSSCSSDLTKYWGKFCFIQTRNTSWSMKWVRFAQGHKVCSGGSHQHAVWFHSLWVSISQALFGSLNPFIPFKVKSHYMLTEIMFSQNNYILHSNVKNNTDLILKPLRKHFADLVAHSHRLRNFQKAQCTVAKHTSLTSACGRSHSSVFRDLQAIPMQKSLF